MTAALEMRTGCGLVPGGRSKCPTKQGVLVSRWRLETQAVGLRLSVNQRDRRGQATCHSLVPALGFLQVRPSVSTTPLTSAGLHKSHLLFKLSGSFFSSFIGCERTIPKHQSVEGLKGMLSRRGWQNEALLGQGPRFLMPQPYSPRASRDSNHQRENIGQIECGCSEVPCRDSWFGASHFPLLPQCSAGSTPRQE